MQLLIASSLTDPSLPRLCTRQIWSPRRITWIAFTCVVFPCLLFAYKGQAAYLMKYPNSYSRIFYASVPGYC
ncbi:hypothetical protein QN277_023653 [Acacia crassicarpa]|uniref:K+ potassium transporter integral membrane domain-containing protein n=1 Tax=Acacia crassicarpa TaxID=499986 RepID=A0AAE1JDL4_9FABA|nr:hypothetical protein QN277_023653 [Acacia crassicarpa]